MPKVIIEIAKGANADQVLAALKAQLGGVADSVSLVTENTKRLEKEQRKAEGAFKSVASSLDPVIRKSLEYERSQRALDEALKRNIISEAEHSRLLGLAKTRYQEATNASVSFAQRSQNAIGGLLGTLGKAQFLIGGLGALGAGLGLGAAIEEAREAQREVALLDAQMANLPATSSITAEAVKQHAAEIGAAFAFDAEEVIRAERGLIRYGVTSEQVLRQASELSADVARSLGIGLTEAAAMVGKALQEPGEGMKALKAAGLGLSDQQIELAKHLAETGQASEAQRLVVASLRDEVEGAAAAYRDTFDGALAAARVSAADLAETIGTALLPGLRDLLNIFAEIGDSPLVSRSLGNVGATLSGVAMGASKSIGLIDQLSNKLRDLTGLDLADVWSFVDPLHLEMILRSSDATEELAAKVRDLAAASAAAAEAERRRREAEKASREEAAETLALGRKSHSDMVAIMARWGQESAAVTGELDRQEAQLQSLLDTLDPVSAVYRKLAEDEADLQAYFERANVPIEKQNELLATLRTRAAAAAGAAAGLAAQEIPLVPVLQPIDRAVLIGQIGGPVEVPATLSLESGGTEFDRESEAATERFSQNMESGLISAGETFLTELMQGGDDAWEHLGENLTQVLIQSVAEWLTAQLAAIVKAAIAARAIKAGGGGGTNGGSGGIDYAGLFQTGYGAYTGTTTASGASAGMSGLGTFAAAAAVMVALVAVLKHQTDRSNAVRYDTTSGVRYENGSSKADYFGNLEKSGTMVAQALDELLGAFQSATGSFIEGIVTAEVQIRNDKEQFRAIVNGVVVGQFKTAQEAIVAAAKEAFLASDLSMELAPVLRTMIQGFQGDDPKKLFEAVTAVQSIIDATNGLTDVEIALRNLPQGAAALTRELMSMGVGFDEATRLSNDWRTNQLNDLRDQITGHQQTAAEEMAQRLRQAAMFNAQVALMRAEIQMKRDELAARVAALQAGGKILEVDLELKNEELRYQEDYLRRKVDAFEADVNVHEWYLQTIGTIGATSLEILQTMIAALDTQLANLPELIIPGEIRIGNRGGGGAGNIDPGPTEAEQRIQSFLDFLENARLEGLTDYQRRLEEINRTFDEQRATLEEMRAASDGSAESLATLAEQEAALAAARVEQAAALREEIIDGLGLPLEAVRDRVAEIQDQVDAWFASGQELVDQYQRGEIGQDELMRKLEEANQLWGEFGSMAQAELQNLALYFTDAMGDTEESARIRAELAEMEWDFKRAELRMLAEAYHAAHVLNDEEYQRWVDFINNLPDNRPADTPAPPPPPQSDPNNAQDEALQAQRDLISALEDLADLQRDLWASNLSPLNAEQQTQFLAGQLQDAFNQAQASGNAEDVRAFQDLVRQYLSSYQDAYGSTGGYSAEFLRINSLINSLLAMGDIGGVVPGPGMLGGTGGTGSTGWRPTPGATGTVLPFERTGGPGSPLVVESPALTAIASLAAETNRRLGALESRLGGLHGAVEAGNERLASKLFTGGRNDLPTMSGRPRIQRRGA